MSRAAPLQQAAATAAQGASPACAGVFVQRSCNCGGPANGSTLRELDEVSRKANRQRKLVVGASTDPLEHEADRVADQVLTAPVGSAARDAPLRIQPFRPQAGSATDVAPLSVERALAEHGQPLGDGLRHDMEQRFGYDFSRVRVHAGAQAAESAAELNAHAYAVGRDIVFGTGRFTPSTGTGRRLIAHELTHVVQQGGAARPGIVQRDLATPPPTAPAAAQADLTAAQIDNAISFNRARYDAASTRLIQDIVGAEPTGKWVAGDIVAIGRLQAEYNFNKDGMVGETFFRFLDREVKHEKLSTKDANCLLAFRVITRPQTVGAVVAGSRSITGNFQVRAQFSNTCGCAAYQYRQFIRGHWRRERAGVVTDLGPAFTTLPGGAGLPAAFIEDGNTSSAAVNYGHRDQPAEDINRYLDRSRAVAQADGCTYESEDTPGGAANAQAGDIFDIDVNFRGEIQRNGRVVRTQNWSAIRGRFPVA